MVYIHTIHFPVKCYSELHGKIYAPRVYRAVAFCAGAECNGGAQLRTQAGYWRSSQNSVNVFPCVEDGPCLGDLNSTKIMSGNKTCRDGHHGPLCAVCNLGYFSSSGGCSCASAPLSIFAHATYSVCTSCRFVEFFISRSLYHQFYDLDLDFLYQGSNAYQ